MQTEGREIEEYTMRPGRAHLYVLLMVVPILVVFLVPFILIWDYETFRIGAGIFTDKIIILLISGIIVHELLHGIGWAFFSPKGIKSIKFGVNWKFLAPYCHCREPLKVKHYRIGGALPLIVLGIGPSVVAIITGNGAMLSFGILFIIAAGGDIISLFMLRKLDRNIYVADHPDKMGFYREIEPGSLNGVD